VPEGHTVDLENPELFVLVELFKVMPPLNCPEDPLAMRLCSLAHCLARLNRASAASVW
jgi:hypothetical protein